MTRTVSPSLGTLIVVAIRWTDRLIGLVSTVILARLLAPEDFGIIAMASLVIGLIDVLLDMGVNVALVQNRSANQDDYDAAWTLRLIQSALSTALILAAAYPAATYFNDPRVTPVVQALAVSVMLMGLENIGIVSFQKNMEFGQEFRFFFGKRVIGFVVTMFFAWYLQSYWALVIGTLAGRGAGVLLSYVMHSMRPKLSFRSMPKMLHFSSWNLLRGIGIYLNENLHRLVVGGRADSSVMGSYTLASDIAAMPSTELLAPMNRVLFPLFVSVKDDADKLKAAYFLALGVQVIVGIPAGVGLALVAKELVLAMLGEKWMAAVPFVQIMGGINIVTALSVGGGYILLVMGRAKAIAIQTWCQVVGFLLVALILFPESGAMVIAQLRFVIAVAGLLAFVYLIRREFPSWHWSDAARQIWRPCLSATLMAVQMHYLPISLSMPVLALLLIKVVVGATVYAVSLVLLWQVSGARDGAESYLWGKLKGAFKLG